MMKPATERPMPILANVDLAEIGIGLSVAGFIIGILLIILGLGLLSVTAAAGLTGKKISFAVVGLGIASIGYWALNSNNRDYNF